jgi:hypothetical protein
VGLNPKFYRAEEGDEGMNKDQELDGAPVVRCFFFTISRKKKDREQLTIPVGGALMRSELLAHEFPSR